MSVGDSPYHHAVKYTQQLPSELFLNGSSEVYKEPSVVTTNFMIERTSLSPRPETID